MPEPSKRKPRRADKSDAMIDWLESDSRNVAFVGRGPKTAPVRVVRDGDRARLTAVVDGSPADKLLQLPHY